MPTHALPLGHGARQPCSPEELAAELDELEYLPFTDPQAALGLAAEAEQASKALGRVDLELRSRLVWADALSRLGDLAAGGRAAHEINRWATEHEHRHLLARSHRLLAWFFYHIGDGSAHLEHAVRSLECIDEQASERMRFDLLITLAGALSANGSHDEARARYQSAETAAAALGAVDLQICVLNNRSYGEYWAGQPTAAMEAAEQMLALAAKHDVALEITELDTVARAQMELGRYADAEQTLLNVPDAAGNRRGVEGDEVAQVLLTLAETQRLLGATDRARATLDRCLALCEERGLASVRVRVLQEQAELFALDGEFQLAFEHHKVFHAETEALLSIERNARARTLQAVFETDEARRDSLRFREMSLRDPLTGLYNRRYVDERIDALLRDAAATGAPLSIGLVDLDYFKRVNDTFSHDIGDQVLKQVASLLSGAVTEPAFAARLGGEEFLLVLPSATAAEAVSCCEAARLRLRSHSWASLTGDLAITASFGVTSAIAGNSTRSAILAVADRNLYAAKRAGRDRVFADPA